MPIAALDDNVLGIDAKYLVIAGWGESQIGLCQKDDRCIRVIAPQGPMRRQGQQVATDSATQIDDCVLRWESRSFVSRDFLVSRLFQPLFGEKHPVGISEFVPGAAAEIDLLRDEVGAVGGEVFSEARDPLNRIVGFDR
jgi:hypothetical protein